MVFCSCVTISLDSKPMCSSFCNAKFCNPLLPALHPSLSFCCVITLDSKPICSSTCNVKFCNPLLPAWPPFPVFCSLISSNSKPICSLIHIVSLGLKPLHSSSLFNCAKSSLPSSLLYCLCNF